MASDGVTAKSRLAQMRMKFQQKQLREREHKRVEMIGVDVDTQETSSLTTKLLGNGKVRQMFDDRRRGVGIDRSNPLKPILNASKSTINSGEKDVLRKMDSTMERKPAAAGLACGKSVDCNRRNHSVRNETFEKTIRNSKSSTNAVYINHNGIRTPYVSNRLAEGEKFSKSFSTLSVSENRAAINEVDDQIPDNPKPSYKHNIKLKPVITKKFPSMANSRVPHLPTLPLSALAITRQGVRSDPSNPSTPGKTPTTVKIQTSQKTSTRKITINTMSNKGPIPSGPPPAGMATCKVCHRNFNEDRLAKHQEICQKMASTKRKIFDASKARIKGTEAEAFLKKPPSKTVAKGPMTYSNAAVTSGGSGLAAKNSNWRKKHEEFIAAIRAAKQLKLHLARGGKLSDLPPPPPSENPDYIQCPHCLRRFNEAAAERHIPKCATMLHNKPKPGTNAKRT